MTALGRLRSAWVEFLSAVQFLTRLPVPSLPYETDSLARAVKFFPLVGLLVGALAALLNRLVAPHLPRLIAALIVLVFLVCVTGCFHEDGLADAADGFGGGWNREQVLLIMRDSRIGSYGAAALCLSVAGRLVLLSSISPMQLTQYLIAGQVLCRWTTLPLSLYLEPARAESDGQGARVARLTSAAALIAGSLFTLVVVVLLLRREAVAPIVAAVAVSLLSGWYYKRRIGGVTGDCFGAANQMTEMAVYLCGVWVA